MVLILPRKLDDITGNRYGRLVVLYRDKKKPGEKPRWVCKCDCGNIVSVFGYHLKRGCTKSCGCYRSEHSREQHKTHGLSRSSNRHNRLYGIWSGIKDRCLNRRSKYWDRYGGAGIGVCDDWANDYMSFHRWSMENEYNDELTLDRIDNSRGYEPDNCRWVSYEVQENNRTNNVIVNCNGKKMTVAQAARETGLSWTMAKKIYGG